MTEPGPTPPDFKPLSGWAVGGITFAAVILVTIGIFQIVEGLAAIIDDDFYVIGRSYAFDLDPTAWGWIHFLIGIVLLAAGYGLFAGATWAGVTAIVVAVLSAVSNFFFIPYYPFWSLLIIALAIWVIWALTRPGALERA
jgi:hypothetical protein